MYAPVIFKIPRNRYLVYRPAEKKHGTFRRKDKRFAFECFFSIDYAQ